MQTFCSIAKYAISGEFSSCAVQNCVPCQPFCSEPTLTPDFVQCLFGCQQHEKVRLLDFTMSSVVDNDAAIHSRLRCDIVRELYVMHRAATPTASNSTLVGLGSLSEPTLLVYSIERSSTSKILSHLENLLPVDLRDDELVHRCTAQRIERVKILDQSLALMVCILSRPAKSRHLTYSQTSNVTDIARSPNTHWRYSIIAIRILRTLIRRDEPLQASQISYFLDKTHDSHPSMVSLLAENGSSGSPDTMIISYSVMYGNVLYIYSF